MGLPESSDDVVLYARVSSDRQDVDLSISAQLKALREYASRKGYRVVGEFVDSAESGRTAYRPKFREMISLARKQDKPFGKILIYKYSRFARSREDSIVYKALLKKNGVQLISTTEPVDNSAMGRLMQAIIECIDEFYSENLGEEVTRGMRESASRGFYLSARPPYGYRKIKVNDGGKDRTRLELDQFQSRVVRTVYEEILNGKGLIEVAKELNSRGVPGPTGKGWGKTGLRKIVGNEINAGTLIWGRDSKRGLPPIRVDSQCPAIVTREEFDRAQAVMKERSFAQTHPRRTSSPFLLSGIIKCGHCGKALVGGEAKSGRYSYYVCGSLLKKGAGACPSHYLNTRDMDGMVIEKVKEHILTPENLGDLARLVTEELNSKVAEHQAEMEPLRAEVVDATRRLERLYDAVETGRIPLDDLAPRIRESKERVDRLKARQSELELLSAGQRAEPATEEEVRECARDLKGLLERGPLTERRSFIRSFVKNITITGDDARLTYTLPMLQKGVDEEAVPVLGIVHYGGR